MQPLRPHNPMRAHDRQYTHTHTDPHIHTGLPTLRMAQFQWFLMALSVRPGSSLAMSFHLCVRVCRYVRTSPVIKLSA
jgi:hypothetical protein